MGLNSNLSSSNSTVLPDYVINAAGNNNNDNNSNNDASRASLYAHTAALREANKMYEKRYSRSVKPLVPPRNENGFFIYTR